MAAAAAAQIGPSPVYLTIDELEEGKCYKFVAEKGPDMEITIGTITNNSILKFERNHESFYADQYGRATTTGKYAVFKDINNNNRDVFINLDYVLKTNAYGKEYYDSNEVIAKNKCFKEVPCPEEMANSNGLGKSGFGGAGAGAAAADPSSNNVNEDPTNPGSTRRKSRKYGGRRKLRKEKKSIKKSRKNKRR